MYLKVEKNGLRYPKATSDYAIVKEIYFADDKLFLRKNFEISGDSVEILQKTKNSRYGNYSIVDKEILKELQGEWQSNDGYCKISIKKDNMQINEERLKIHILKSNSENTDKYRIVDINPEKYEIYHLAEMTYSNGQITALIPICDAPSLKITFNKIKKV